MLTLGAPYLRISPAAFEEFAPNSDSSQFPANGLGQIPSAPFSLAGGRSSEPMATGIILCTRIKELMDIQKIVTELSGERNRLDRAIAALESLSQPARRRGLRPQSEAGYGPFQRQAWRHNSRRAQASLRDDEETVGRAEEESHSQTPGDERSRQKEVVSLDESALGGKEDSSIRVDRDSRSAAACQCARAGNQPRPKPNLLNVLFDELRKKMTDRKDEQYFRF